MARPEFIVMDRQSVLVRHPDGTPYKLLAGQFVPEWVGDEQIDEWLAGGFVYLPETLEEDYAGPSMLDIRAEAQARVSQRIALREAEVRVERQRRFEERQAARMARVPGEVPFSSAKVLGPSESELNAQREREAAQRRAKLEEELRKAKEREHELELAEERAEEERKRLEARIQHPGLWNRDPESLVGLELEKLQISIAEIASSAGIEDVVIPESVEECIELLSSEFVPGTQKA